MQNQIHHTEPPSNPLTITRIALEGLTIVLAFGLLGLIPVQYRGYVIVGVMLYVPLADRHLPTFDWWPSRRKVAWRWLGTSLLFLGGFVVVMELYRMQQSIAVHSMDPGAIGRYGLNTLLGAAGPEEWFFRYFLLQRFARALPHRPAKWWVPGKANLAVATVFALVHVAVELNPMRAIVWFPALWYGAMAEQKAGLIPVVAAHALSNIVMYGMLMRLGL